MAARGGNPRRLHFPGDGVEDSDPHLRIAQAGEAPARGAQGIVFPVVASIRQRAPERTFNAKNPP